VAMKKILCEANTSCAAAYLYKESTVLLSAEMSAQKAGWSFFKRDKYEDDHGRRCFRLLIACPLHGEKAQSPKDPCSNQGVRDVTATD